jgi:transcriptional regulator with AAA-type ATPase domain
MIAIEERIVQKFIEDYPLTDSYDFNLIVNKVRSRLINQAMTDAKQNVTEAASLLGMIRTTLNQIIVDWERRNEAKRSDSFDDLRSPAMAWGRRRGSKQWTID